MLHIDMVSHIKSFRIAGFVKKWTTIKSFLFVIAHGQAKLGAEVDNKVTKLPWKAPWKCEG